MYGRLTMTPEVDGDGVLVGSQGHNIHADRRISTLFWARQRGKNAQVVTIKITKCYNSAIAIIEAKGSCGDKGVAGETFRRKRPERGSGHDEEGKGGKDEEA
jgi:hypothetical protein